MKALACLVMGASVVTLAAAQESKKPSIADSSGPAAALRAPPAKADGVSAHEIERGQKYFVVHCARCHGIQGHGGEGPSLARPRLNSAPDLPSLINVIENGISGTGMPGFWLVPKKDLRAIAGYVQSIGTATEVPLSGNPHQGRELFTRAACNQCHTVRGQGGVTGPDLSDVGNRRGSDRLRRMLIEPAAERIKNADGYTEYLPVRITTTTGTVVEGLRTNEDGFTIQLRDLENRIHSFRKSDVKEMTKGFAQSLMPSFASTFNSAELDDLVAYLAGLRTNP